MKVNNPTQKELTAVVYGVSLAVPVGQSDAPEMRTPDGTEHDSAHVAQKIVDQLQPLGVAIVQSDAPAEAPPKKPKGK